MGKNFQIDIMRVQQVLINLMSNAIKYSPFGATIRMEAKLRPLD